MIGERFRVARARKNLTLRDVAAACDCTAQAVHKWEDGSQLPNSRRLMTFIRLTDVSAEWLLDPDPLDFKLVARRAAQ